MLLPPERRQELGTFLRARREATAPAEAGLLPGAARRRTPGLRREELAQLCGISTTWYTWTEQGRDISLSAEALARLANALRMTAAERAYLFELTKKRDPAPPGAPAGTPPAPSELAALMEAIHAPAYLLDRLWHARAWNQPAEELFAPWLASGETSLLRFVFLDPAARDFISGWEDRARRLLAEFRADTVHDPDDAEVTALVGGLKRESPAFLQFWNSFAVLGRDGGARMFNHPTRGAVTYTQITLVPATAPHHKLVILVLTS
jgi:transcriptional regulator with XRE-family HTH domain